MGTVEPAISWPGILGVKAATSMPPPMLAELLPALLVLVNVIFCPEAELIVLTDPLEKTIVWPLEKLFV